METSTVNSQEELLRKIASRVAQRGFHYDKAHLENILYDIALLLSRAGYSDQVDVF